MAEKHSYFYIFCPLLAVPIDAVVFRSQFKVAIVERVAFCSAQIPVAATRETIDRWTATAGGRSVGRPTHSGHSPPCAATTALRPRQKEHAGGGRGTGGEEL